MSAVRWGVTANLVFAWILTFPICAIISWVVVKVVRTLFYLWHPSRGQSHVRKPDMKVFAAALIRDSL